jgi:hypothetical protein
MENLGAIEDGSRKLERLQAIDSTGIPDRTILPFSSNDPAVGRLTVLNGGVTELKWKG